MLRKVNFVESDKTKLLNSIKYSRVSDWKPFKRLHKVESDIDIHLVDINDRLIENQKQNFHDCL